MAQETYEISADNLQLAREFYKGVEGLLVEIYDALGEGEHITDERVKSEVLRLLGTARE